MQDTYTCESNIMEFANFSFVNDSGIQNLEYYLEYTRGRQW